MSGRGTKRNLFFGRYCGWFSSVPRFGVLLSRFLRVQGSAFAGGGSHGTFSGFSGGIFPFFHCAKAIFLSWPAGFFYPATVPGSFAVSGLSSNRPELVCARRIFWFKPKNSGIIPAASCPSFPDGLRLQGQCNL